MLNVRCSVTLEKADALPQILFDYIVEGFFILDIIFNFFQAYIHHETKENVRDLRRIAIKYVFK